MLSFFAKAKVSGLADQLCTALAKMDPATMTEAGMLQLDKQLTEVCNETAASKADYLKEQREADQINELYNKKLAAAEILSNRLSSASDADKPRIEESLTKLVSELEKLRGDVEREVAEAVQAKALFEQLETTSRELANQFKDARKQFEDLQRQLKQAEASEKRANIQAERSKVLQGLQTGSGQLGSAMEAMKAATAKAQANADAAQRKAVLLAPTTLEQDDELIASAMKEASGEVNPATTSISDRLAALKNK